MKGEDTLFLLHCMYMRRHSGEMELWCMKEYAGSCFYEEQQAVLYGAVMSRKKIDAGVFQIDMIASSPQSELKSLRVKS